MAGALRKRSITIAGHRTSISLEPAFWAALEQAAAARGCSLARLVEEIDRNRDKDTLSAATSLSSALRVFLLSEARLRP
jgi:predicted DNA-binding ribbon-helix-helix protein